MERGRKLQHFLLFPSKSNDHALACEQSPANSLAGQGKAAAHSQLPRALWGEGKDSPTQSHAPLTKKIEEKLMLSRASRALLCHEPLLAERDVCSEDDVWIKGLLALENLNMPADAPRGYAWASKEALEKHPLQELPKQKWKNSDCPLKRLSFLPALAEQLFTESATGMRKSPWEKRGWRNAASSWIFDKLKDAELTATSLPGRVSGPSESIVMSVEEVSGRKVLFKAQKSWKSWRMWPSEALIASYLSELLPSSLIPSALSIDAQREWMLTAQFGEDLDEQDNEPCAICYAPMLGAMSIFQKERSKRISELCCASCRCKGMNFIRATFFRAINDPEICDLIGSEAMTALVAGKQRIERIFRSIKELDMPDALCHGDLWWPSIALPREESEFFTFFDWESASASHPFADARRALARSRLDNAKLVTAKETCLARWKGYAGMGALRKAWAFMPIADRMLRIAELRFAKRSRRNSSLKASVEHLLKKLSS